MAGLKFDQSDVGPKKGARGMDVDDIPFFRLRFWPQGRCPRSGCDPADRIRTPIIGSAAKLEPDKGNVAQIQALGARFGAKIRLMEARAGSRRPPYSTYCRCLLELPAGAHHADGAARNVGPEPGFGRRQPKFGFDELSPLRCNRPLGNHVRSATRRSSGTSGIGTPSMSPGACTSRASSSSPAWTRSFGRASRLFCIRDVDQPEFGRVNSKPRLNPTLF